MLPSLTPFRGRIRRSLLSDLKNLHHQQTRRLRFVGTRSRTPSSGFSRRSSKLSSSPVSPHKLARSSPCGLFALPDQNPASDGPHGRPRSSKSYHPLSRYAQTHPTRLAFPPQHVRAEAQGPFQERASPFPLRFMQASKQGGPAEPLNEGALGVDPGLTSSGSPQQPCPWEDTKKPQPKPRHDKDYEQASEKLNQKRPRVKDLSIGMAAPMPR